MNAITQEINLNLIPGAIPPRISVSQYDDASRSLVFRLYNGAVSFTPGSGTTVQIRGTKPDNKGFEYAASIAGSTVTAAITDQMTAVAGDVRCEIVLKDSTKTIGTGNFVLEVERAALGEDTDISETVIPDIIDAAEANAERAEAAADRAEEASVHAPYIGQNEDWYVWDTVSEQYVDSGVDARGDDGEDGTSIANITKTGTAGLVDTYTVTLTDGTTYTFTVTNGQNGTDGQDGQDGADGEDGVGIADIEKTSTVGLVDTYTITLTDQTTYTFTVTNGQNAIPGGGTTGQVLTKLSNTSGDAGWQTPASGSSSLADLTDTTISSPTAAQPLTYDATNSKWVNGGIIPAANGGTGNATGYVQAGRKANTTIGSNATAEGQQTTASGSRSHAEGYDTKATANCAHAEGSGTTASNGCAHAEGSLTTASGNYSHAQNRYTVASAESTSAAGSNTTAGYANQFVVGKYNDNKSTSIFEVGIGTGANAKANGLELDTSGNLKTAGTITDGQGHVLGAGGGAPVVWDSATSANDTLCLPLSVADVPTLTVGGLYVLKIKGDFIAYDNLSLGRTSWGLSMTISGTTTTWANCIASGVDGTGAYLPFTPDIHTGDVITLLCVDATTPKFLVLSSNKDKEYCEATVTTSTSSDVTATFYNVGITTDSEIEVGTSGWGIVPSDVTVTAGVCTVTIPKADSAQSITVRIYVR